MRMIGFLAMVVTATMAHNIGRVDDKEAAKSKGEMDDLVRRWQKMQDEENRTEKDLHEAQWKRGIELMIKQQHKHLLKIHNRMRGFSWTSDDEVRAKRTFQEQWKVQFYRTYKAEREQRRSLFNNKKAGILPKLQKLALKSSLRIECRNAETPSCLQVDYDKIIEATEQLKTLKHIIDERAELMEGQKRKLGVFSHWVYDPKKEYDVKVTTADFSNAADWGNIQKLKSLRDMLESKLKWWNSNVVYTRSSGIPLEEIIEAMKEHIEKKMNMKGFAMSVFDTFLKKSKDHEKNLKNLIKELSDKMSNIRDDVDEKQIDRQ